MGVSRKTRNQTAIRTGRSKRAAQSGRSGASSQTGPADAPGLTPEERIWQVVAAIPRGRVATYGQIADLAGMPRHARLVGRTLSNLPKGTRLPWHRVVNAALSISKRGDDRAMREQRRRLEREGVTFVGARIARAHRWES
ncbi:MAG TPA: MGMT family protein [Pseudomonadales bacterium]